MKVLNKSFSVNLHLLLSKEMLKQVQHDNNEGPSFCVIPNLFRDLGFGFQKN